MCDIWKDNRNLKQLNESDIRELLVSLKKLGTRQVLMSGGEALLNPHFFKFCQIIRGHNIKISLLSTGLTLSKHADQLVKWVNDIIISLDGPEELHNQIRNIPGAYQKLKEGIREIRKISPSFQITARTVIHRLNFRHWPEIVASAKDLGVQQVSFLPADISSHAFNREILWSDERQQDILPKEHELEDLRNITVAIISKYKSPNEKIFIAESPAKLMNIFYYYAAFYQRNPFPYKKCNAPWVSTVVEADGTVRPCFFHPAVGNIRVHSLTQILNNEKSIRFREELDIDKDPVCVKCVCYLNLSPATKLN
jgi:MoaA/NifB/PqqE/SkfB family radical SAM enzyme